jgi:hypothetical protein
LDVIRHEHLMTLTDVGETVNGRAEADPEVLARALKVSAQPDQGLGLVLRSQRLRK